MKLETKIDSRRITTFWDVTLCNLIDHYQYFRECTKQGNRDISIKDRIGLNQTHTLIFRRCLLQILTGKMAMLTEVSVVFLSPSMQMPG
jgi:hypothetical protein